MVKQSIASLSHATYGKCELVRMEGANWVVLVADWEVELRIPPSRRNEFVTESLSETAPKVSEDSHLELGTRLNAPSGKSIEPVYSAQDLAPISITSVGGENALSKQDSRRIQQAFRSIGNGLPPQDSELTRYFTVGLEDCFEKLEAFSAEADSSGGSVLVVRGPYGCGKTLTLNCSRSIALQSGFAMARTEIDATEVCLQNAPSVYQSLMRDLTFPDGGIGIDHLIVLVGQWLDRISAPSDPYDLYQFLVKKTQCEPLAWMFADRNLARQEDLVDALKGQPLSAGYLKNLHVLGDYVHWKYFYSGTQGDLGCYLISGLSKLIRLVGFKGLIVALDEMEKWQDLDWKSQDRASNLLGGLIWSATAEVENRTCEKFSYMQRCGHPVEIGHSNVANGAPFGTQDRCHLGLLIAMTPRGSGAPEIQWRKYGRINITDLPKYTLASFDEHYAKIAPLYGRVHNFVVPDECHAAARDELVASGDIIPRSASNAIVGALDDYRRSCKHNV